jgi:hypothetical protein
MRPAYPPRGVAAFVEVQGAAVLRVRGRRVRRMVVGWQLASNSWLVECGVLDGVERLLTASCGHPLFCDQPQLERQRAEAQLGCEMAG